MPVPFIVKKHAPDTSTEAEWGVGKGVVEKGFQLRYALTTLCFDFANNNKKKERKI